MSLGVVGNNNGATSGIVSLPFHPASSSPLVISDKAYRGGRPLSESGGALHLTALLLRLRYFTQKRKRFSSFGNFKAWGELNWRGGGACFVQRGRSPPRLIRKEGDCVPHLMKWECYLSRRGWGGVYVCYQRDVFGIPRALLPSLLKKNLNIECSYVEIALMSCFMCFSFTFYLLCLVQQRRSSSVCSGLVSIYFPDSSLTLGC